MSLSVLPTILQLHHHQLIMDKVSEDVQTLTHLIQSLGNQLNESNNQINTLKLAAQKLVSKEEYDQLSLIKPRNLQEVEEDDEDIIIQELEKEKLGHMMDLQKQDFISDKLLELIEQNRGIVESVKEFFQHKQEIRSDDEAISDNRLEHFKSVMIQPNIDLINLSVADLQKKMGVLLVSFAQVQQAIDKDSGLLLSPDYQENVKELIDKLNNLFHDYISVPDAKEQVLSTLAQNLSVLPSPLK